MTRTQLRSGLLIAAVLSTMLPGGCSSPPKRAPRPTVERLQLRHQVGGAHYRAVLHEEYGYQAFGTSLLAIDPTTGEVLSSIAVGDFGKCGPLIDVAMVDGVIIGLVRNEAIVEFTLRNPRRPLLNKRIAAAEIGIVPKSLSIAHGPDGPELFVCGKGGVVRWSDRRIFLRGEETYTSVAHSDYGFVATHGRQVVRINNAEFVGSASTLHQMPESDQLVFTRTTNSGTLVGVMGPDVRELDAINGTRAIPGPVRSIRFFHGAIWIVGDDRIIAMEPDGSTRHWITIRGARHVTALNTNYLAIAGTFGRAVYRIAVDEHGFGDTFVRVVREPSNLKVARTDGRYILAGSEEGNWLYLIGAHADLVERSIEPAEISRTAATGGAEAVISADNRSLLLTLAEDTYEYRLPDGGMMHTVVASAGHFWIGHDGGIAVLHTSPQPPSDPKAPFNAETAFVRDHIVLDGPVRYIFPLTVGGGVSYVAELGGFGTAEYRKILTDELPEDEQ